jgi:hypothetical protein
MVLTSYLAAAESIAYDEVNPVKMLNKMHHDMAASIANSN